MGRWWRAGALVAVLGCGSGTVMVGMDATDDLDSGVSDGASEATVEAGADSGVDVDAGPLMCPLHSYVAGEKYNCFATADQVCNPKWPCSDAATFGFHYQCTAIGTPPFPLKAGVPQCGELDAGSRREFCCAEQRCVRYDTLDPSCPKTAGHDFNWGCPKFADGGFLIPPKYDSGATAICSPNPAQPEQGSMMLCCDDVGP